MKVNILGTEYEIIKELDINKYQNNNKQPFLQEQLRYNVNKSLLEGYDINT